MTNNAETTETETVTVHESWSVPVVATYHGPTNTKGSRIRVHRADDTYNSDPMRLTVSWAYELNAAGNFRAAVEQYLARHVDAGHGWDGDWIIAGGKDSYTAVKVPKGFIADGCGR